MKKLVRSTYPAELNIVILSLIFLTSCFFSHHIFDLPFHEQEHRKNAYFGMFLVGIAVLLMVVIIWEEILFPIKVKEVKGGLIFRNHRKKLKTQIFIYSLIPLIFGFIYFKFEVNHIHFFIWLIACTITPIAEKIFSGIKNYNDFLKLTTAKIEYKNNQKEGSFDLKDVQYLVLIKNEKRIVTKIQLTINNSIITIDLDEMELNAFYDSIYKYITVHYKHLLKETKMA